MFRKMVCLSLAFLMSNACAMDKYGTMQKINVVVGAAVNEIDADGNVHSTWDEIEHTVMPGSKVVVLKRKLMGSGYLTNVSNPLYVSRGTYDSEGNLKVRTLSNNELLEDVAKNFSCVSIFSTIHETKQ